MKIQIAPGMEGELELSPIFTMNPNYSFHNNGMTFLHIDNAYELRRKIRYIDFINQHNIKNIYSQDYDISYLKECPRVEFVVLSKEAYNLDVLYQLENLKGLVLATDDLEFDFSKLSNKFSTLFTSYESKNKTWLNSVTITGLSFSDFRTLNLNFLSKLTNKDNLKFFEIGFSYAKFQSLKGIENIANIESLILNYCRQLKDISDIYQLKKLRFLRLSDNPKCREIDYTKFTNLEELYLVDTERTESYKIKSIDFIQKLKKLKVFETDYNILDGDLTPLLRLKHSDIFQDRKHYNLKKCDLPSKK